MQLGLQHRPEIALLDVSMPRLDGIEVALMLREQHPQLRAALQTADPAAHYERARAEQLPLFDKLQIARALAWVKAQAHAGPARSLVCSVCGYGIVRAMPPDRCPMCQTERTWRSVRARA